jgi:hypothetical protein
VEGLEGFTDPFLEGIQGPGIVPENLGAYFYPDREPVQYLFFLHQDKIAVSYLFDSYDHFFDLAGKEV